MNNLKLISVASALLFSVNSLAFTIQLPPLPGGPAPCFPHEKPLPLPKFEFPKLNPDQCIGLLCSPQLEQIVAPYENQSLEEVATQTKLIEKNIAAIQMLEQALAYSVLFESIQDLSLRLSYPPEIQALQSAVARFKQNYANDYKKAFTNLNLDIKDINSNFGISREVLFHSFTRMLGQEGALVMTSANEYKNENVNLLLTYQNILNTLSN